MDKTKRRMQQARQFYRRRGESVFGSMCSTRHCVRRAVGLADYHWALPRIAIVLPWQCNPCTDCKSAQ